MTCSPRAHSSPCNNLLLTVWADQRHHPCFISRKSTTIFYTLYCMFISKLALVFYSVKGTESARKEHKPPRCMFYDLWHSGCCLVPLMHISVCKAVINSSGIYRWCKKRKETQLHMWYCRMGDRIRLRAPENQ